jgi:hypothetical protein
MTYTKFHPQNYSDEELERLIESQGGELSREMLARYNILKESLEEAAAVLTRDTNGYQIFEGI